MSLRILDFFITTYSKKNNTKIQNSKDPEFDVYQNYRLTLRGYRKQSFDVFCRKNKMLFYYGKTDNESIETSCGQLCFFKWCYENGIVDYVKKNFEMVDQAMKKSSPKRKKFKTNGKGVIVKFD